MSGFETLAQVYREIAYPKMKNLRITGNLVCIYAVFSTGIITLFAGMSPDNFNIQNPVATNLGILFNGVDNPVLYTAASFVDIFAIWTLVLTAIGFTCVSKAKLGPALAIVFVWYIAFAGIFVGLAAAFS